MVPPPLGSPGDGRELGLSRRRSRRFDSYQAHLCLSLRGIQDAPGTTGDWSGAHAPPTTVTSLPSVQQRIEDELRAAGARIADPGDVEFGY
ncbi:MAG: hypothetical protein ACRDQZ_10670 [Mycobacteriales bacterium]